MFDFDSFHDALHHIGSEGFSFDNMSFDQFTDILAQADIDISQLSPEEMESFFSSMTDENILPDTATDFSGDEIRFGQNLDMGNVRFGATTEFEDGTKIDNPHTDALGYVYKSTEDWINGTNKNVVS